MFVLFVEKVHNESEVAVMGDVLIKRGRGRPRYNKPPEEKKPRGRPTQKTYSNEQATTRKA